MTPREAHATRPADFYAALHTGTPGDIAYYQRACSDAGSVLELGCGYGRVLEALGESKAACVGMDRDLDLLRLAARRVESAGLVCGDMRRFAFARQFDRILLPYTGIYCLADDGEVVACFERVREHLAASGRFIFDAYCAEALHGSGEGSETMQPDAPDTVEDSRETNDDVCDDDVAIVEVGDSTYHVSEQSDWNPERQEFEVVYVYEPRSGGHSIASTIRHRYLLLDQIAPLLARAGLELVSLTSGFDDAPIDASSEHFVAVAKQS
ncbi:MAG: class I SAM-dependent methyltransferase [Myxococcota bacterium]|jgi:SAM-dependent methyltransferase|nr:class I SAM-dependent methyltransferase [Myxococcota bacterium]